MPGKSYFQDGSSDFVLFATPGRPGWRPPQLGALGALTAHWSTQRSTPALISLPTGTGKTGVATAVPHLLAARRVLVVVPSTELRRQLAAAFRNEDVLLAIGALTRQRPPEVREVPGLVNEWGEFRASDVVVSLPNSISPSRYPNDPPPSDLFDLIVVDEAHHAPAPTWMAILEHYFDAKAVLLTATPRRRDGRRLPGDHVYHYPLRQALDEGIFKPIDARVLNVPNGATQDMLDAQIIESVSQLIGESTHATSTLMVRAGNRTRAADLAR
jgi:superfamily II DNA or RNA helicase